MGGHLAKDLTKAKFVVEKLSKSGATRQAMSDAMASADLGGELESKLKDILPPAKVWTTAKKFPQFWRRRPPQRTNRQQTILRPTHRPRWCDFCRSIFIFIHFAKKQGTNDILFIAANPTNAHRAEVDQLYHACKNGVKQSSSFPPIDFVDNWDDAAEKLEEEARPIVQIVCHGQPAGGQGVLKTPEILWFSDADKDHPKATHVAAALKEANTVCALLIACHTGKSFAKTLSAEIPYLVVSSGELDLPYAQRFMKKFYTMLEKGASLETCLQKAKSGMKTWASYDAEKDSIRVYIKGQLLE